MPDYLINIGNQLQFEQLRDGVPIRDINKVIILGNKEKPMPEFLALSAEFRDRLLIGYVPKSAEEVFPEFPDVTKYPDVFVFQSYDNEAEKIMEGGQMHQLGDQKYMTFKLLKRFVERFALKKPRNRIQPRKLTPFIEIYMEH